MIILKATRRSRKAIFLRELSAEWVNQISRLNRKLNAFLALLEEDARLCTKQADKKLAVGYDRCPPRGIPISVKGVFHMKNVQTTAGPTLSAVCD
jgi:Asp-tRNA(Asn)/Glu-tRNA(Gln) amidotransferase A subunit family amidase